MKSDLSILEEFGASLAPTHEVPAEVRHRVMTGMRHATRQPRLLSKLAGVRLAWRIGAPSAVAAAVAAALVVGQLNDIAGGKPAPPGHGATSQAVPTTLPNAGQVLQLAAQHATATAPLDARPNQFLFIDSVDVQAGIDRNGKTSAEPVRTRTWLSVDGTHDGLVLEATSPSPRRTVLDGCKNGLQAETIDRPETTPKIACTPEPAYQPGSIPSDPDRLLDYVYGMAKAEPEWRSVGRDRNGNQKGFVRISDDQRAFMEIAILLHMNHLPAVQAAAFQVAGKIPGVQLRRNVADAAGRVGVAVTRTEAGSREELVFDSATYKFLGHNVIETEFDLNGAKLVPRPQRGRTLISEGPTDPGAVIVESALLRVAIVNKAGQLP